MFEPTKTCLDNFIYKIQEDKRDLNKTSKNQYCIFLKYLLLLGINVYIIIY